MHYRLKDDSDASPSLEKGVVHHTWTYLLVLYYYDDKSILKLVHKN